MTRLSVLCLLGTTCCLLFLTLLTTPVLAGDSLVVTSPSNLFTYAGQRIPEKPSLFGLPNYAKKLSGQLFYPSTNKYGCDSTLWAPNSFLPASGENGNPTIPTLIALINRGDNCTFATKVLNAQVAGARAVIIVNDDASALPFMAAPEDSGITIPAMIISLADGKILKDALANRIKYKAGIQVSMSYFLPNPDDRVEIDYYTAASNHPGNKFANQFRAAVATLSPAVLFTPRYAIRTQYIDVDASPPTPQNCYEPTADCNDPVCGDLCTNCGRYCAFDPDGNVTAGASGADVVVEQIRAKCVWLYGNNTNNPTLWFDYEQKHDQVCASDPNLAFDTDCSMGVMQSLSIDTKIITTCMGVVAKNESVENDVAKSEIAWHNTLPIPTSMMPKLIVNNVPYNGDLTCPDPLTPECSPLQMVCAGFAIGKVPIACTSPLDCPLGSQYDACNTCRVKGQDANWVDNANDCGKGSSGIGVGAVIGIIILFVVLIAAGVYFYMRRRENKMRDDIDSLLKQYLPLDSATGSSGTTNGNGKHTAPRDPNSNLRLIGNLESSDEPTDL